MTTETEEEEKRKKGDSKKEGAGSMGASRGVPTPAFFEYMLRIGASMERINQILMDWSHLRADALRRRLAAFSRDLPRASAHAEVQFDKGDFSLISNLFRFFKSRDIASLRAKLSHDENIKLG
ncbi:MAG: hypothetical protein HGA90_03340 [Alphaproteobacteria bacterium]|nr:hypothetical protein [Alphaproteobacteria bacterium]